MARIIPKFYLNFKYILQSSECKCLPPVCELITRDYSKSRSSAQGNKQRIISHSKPSTNSLRRYGIQGQEGEKLSIFQKFKKMYKEYWYVLIPVHVVTSIGWFGGFYYMAKSGVDIISLLESMHVSEKIVDSMRDSRMGYFAIAYGCYKIATPARYTVTLGGTTISINYLKKWGYIKPVPSAVKLKEMYIEKRGKIDKSMREKKEDLIAKKDELKSKIDDKLEKGKLKIEKLKDKTLKK